MVRRVSLPPARRDYGDVEFAAALAAESEFLAVGRLTVPVGLESVPQGDAMRGQTGLAEDTEISRANNHRVQSYR